jgi:Flp pilus assembly protein TadD
VNSVLPAQVYPRQSAVFDGYARRWLGIALVILCCACSSTPPNFVAQRLIAPLELPDRTVELEEVAFLAPRMELLEMDEDMKSFVAQYAGYLRTERQRMRNLHSSITSSSMLNLQYDPFAEGSAQEAFHRGSVNCLSFANMFVAMAREAKLDAQYQWVDVRPQWTRIGERVAVRLHVNVVVKLRNGEEYMADIDPLETRDITSTHLISDREAEALYHSNIAMDALSEEQLDSAWGHAVRAVQLSPGASHLWVNLGAVYRISGQHEEAEQSYLHALRLDPEDRSAMNNLAVLYGMLGRMEEHAYWQQQIERYQLTNPYYHAWLGDQAGEEGDWPKALTHYLRAVSLGSGDSRLLYATGLIYYELEEYEDASRLISEAIDHATLRTEINSYQIRLEAVKREHLAGV